MQKQKVYRETSRIPELFQKKTAKSVFAKPQLKSGGQEEEYFRVCTGTVTVILWTPFVLSALLPTRHASKCMLLPQKHSFSSTVLQRKTTPRSGYPSLHFLSHLPVRSRCPQAPSQVWDSLQSPLLRERNVGTGHRSLRHHSTLCRPFSIGVTGTNAATHFPSNPCFKITLGCGRKASKLTLPHRALF